MSRHAVAPSTHCWRRASRMGAGEPPEGVGCDAALGSLPRVCFGRLPQTNQRERRSRRGIPTGTVRWIPPSRPSPVFASAPLCLAVRRVPTLWAAEDPRRRRPSRLQYPRRRRRLQTGRDVPRPGAGAHARRAPPPRRSAAPSGATSLRHAADARRWRARGTAGAKAWLTACARDRAAGRRRRHRRVPTPARSGSRIGQPQSRGAGGRCDPQSWLAPLQTPFVAGAQHRTAVWAHPPPRRRRAQPARFHTYTAGFAPVAGSLVVRRGNDSLLSTATPARPRALLGAHWCTPRHSSITVVAAAHFRGATNIPPRRRRPFPLAWSPAVETQRAGTGARRQIQLLAAAPAVRHWLDSPRVGH